jgi:NAD(P) transhydrogenase subunit alpha
VPYDASQLYARNVASLLQYLVREGKVATDSTDDEIIRDTMLCHDGKITSARMLGSN